jgi:hypothetical protein
MTLALFIDGPKQGETLHVQPGMMSYRVNVYQDASLFSDDSQEYPPTPLGMGMIASTVTYKPVMIGILSRLSLWSIKPDNEALSSFLSLITPALRITRDAEYEIRDALL